MTTGSNARKFFTGGRGERRSSAERVAVEQATAEADAPVALRPGEVIERDAPDHTVYLDPDIEGGRSRIVIMLSEDKTIIEPVLRIKLSDAQYASILAQQAEIVAQEMTARQLAHEREVGQLTAEIVFLREQIHRGAQPPPAGVVPPPFADAQVGG